MNQPFSATDFAFAGFIHDIGKFSERAKMSFDEAIWDKEKSIKNADIYQPRHYTGKDSYYLTHKHALFSAYFFEQFKSFLPDQFTILRENYPGESIQNIAAKHHCPETPYQWIVAQADRLAAGMDRHQFDEYNKEMSSDLTENSRKNFKEYYREARLLPIVETIRLENDSDKLDSGDYKSSYPLNELSPDSIIPKKNIKIGDPKDYEILWKKFEVELCNLPNKNNAAVWLDHFETLVLKYCHAIPSATVGNTIPDVSLYDHCKLTGALASALFLYHSGKNDLETLKDFNDSHLKEERFVLIQGKWNGIQDYIFSEGNSTNKKSAKLLRGRSASVSIFTELAAKLVLEEFSLSQLSLVQSGAGKFQIIGPNSIDWKNKINKVETEIQNWLLDTYYGEVSFSLVGTVFSGEELIQKNKLNFLFKRIGQALEIKKFSKFQGSKLWVFRTYLDKFNDDLTPSLCPYCGKRPSVHIENEDPKCRSCHDEILIGTELPKNSFLQVILSKEGELQSPIFGKFQLKFRNKSEDQTLKMETISIWKVDPWKNEITQKTYAERYLGNYIPLLTEVDFQEYLKKFSGSKEEAEQLIGEAGNPATFHYISSQSISKDSNSEYIKGVEALAVLQADVDYLGSIFQNGIPKATFSKYISLARQLNYYFSVRIAYLLNTIDEYKSIYTVFAGGDDLILIGPYNRVLSFVRELQFDFAEFSSQNPEVHFSAGISLHKAFDPIRTMMEKSEFQLEQAKLKRDSISIFSEMATWREFLELEDIEKQLTSWRSEIKSSDNEPILSTSMAYRILNFSEKANLAFQMETRIKEKKASVFSNLRVFLWRSQLKYSFGRNFGNKVMTSGKKVIDEVSSIPEWIEKWKGKMKIPIWLSLYATRRNKK